METQNSLKLILVSFYEHYTSQEDAEVEYLDKNGFHRFFEEILYFTRINFLIK